MILTVTLNPTTDRTLEVPHFEVGRHARARLVALVPAGKGINVARGLVRLGSRALACGLVGRWEAPLYAESLRRDGVECALCPVEGTTRSNTTILDPTGGTTTHLREQGFTVKADDVARLRSRLAEGIRRCRADAEEVTTVFSGSLPPGLKEADWLSLLRHCRGAGARIVLDTGGDALRAALDSGLVDTIKPNLAELARCLGQEVERAEAPERAAELLDRTQTVLLTLGAEGAFAICRDGTMGVACRLDPARVRNTVGCGDAFLAGWLYGVETCSEVAAALRWGAAAGAASACSDTTAGYTRREVEQLLPNCEAI